jgi:hypothetical protein
VNPEIETIDRPIAVPLALSQIGWNGQTADAACQKVRLRGDPERPLNEAYLPNYVAFRQPSHLPFADHVRSAKSTPSWRA